MRRPTFISLFSGCGGFDQGFIWAGYKPLAAFDNWPLAIQHYTNNIGNHAEIWDLSTAQLPRKYSCDVVLAGSPCQGFSTVGKRLLDDPRNKLLYAAVEISLRIKPAVIVMENVQGVLQGKHRSYWDHACSMLREAGYSVTTTVINAQDIGVPQSRKRAILVAWNVNKEYEVSVQQSPPPTLIDALLNVEHTPNHEPKMFRSGSFEYEVALNIGPGQKLCNVRAGDAAVHTWDIPKVFGKISDNDRELLETIMRLRRRMRVRDHGDADPVQLDDLEKTLNRKVKRQTEKLIKIGYLRRRGAGIDLTNVFNGKYRRPHPEGISPTVDSKFGDPKCFLHPLEQRGFSVREAARIQGFSDDYLFHGPIRDQYKLIGNAVPPPLGKAVAEDIRKKLLGTKSSC